MTYQTEFPDFAAADMPQIPAGWQDISWHNDSCPGFSATPQALAGTGVSIWVDYADASRREVPESPRFTVYMTDAEGNQIADFSTDDWAELLAQAELFAHRWVLISLLQGQIDDEAQAVEFITALHVTGCSYHFEDDATECLAGIDWLTDADRVAINDIVASIYALDCWTKEHCPCSVALSLDEKTAA